MSLYLGEQKIADNTCSRNIGEIIQSTIPLSDAGLHLLDGALISNVGSYAKFVTYIAGLVTDYPDLFETEANWQSAVTTYGVCGKFVYDSENNTVRLPKYSNKIYTGGGTAPVVGNGMTLGLTNGTDNLGTVASWGNSGYGTPSFTYRGTTDTYGSNIGTSSTQDYKTNINKSLGLATDATKSGIIADLSNITTALDGYYYIVIASSITNELNLDVADMADKDFSNITSTGTSLASGWSMPSSRHIDLTVGASGAPYTAPANGYFVAKATSSSSSRALIILEQTDNISSGNYSYSSGTGLRTFVNCEKGKIVYFTYENVSIESFQFVYAEGEN